MKEKISLIGQATQEEINSWKNKFGEIYAAKADNHIAYFKKPSRQQLSYILTIKNNPMKQTESLMQGCFVGGSEAILTDTEYFLSAANILKKLIEIKNVEVEKL